MIYYIFTIIYNDTNKNPSLNSLLISNVTPHHGGVLNGATMLYYKNKYMNEKNIFIRPKGAGIGSPNGPITELISKFKLNPLLKRDFTKFLKTLPKEVFINSQDWWYTYLLLKKSDFIPNTKTPEPYK
jgi:hypothetical protein